MKNILIILALFLSGIVSGQVTLVGEKAAKIVVNAGADATVIQPTTIQLSGKLTGHPTDYYWTHNGLGTIADSTKLNTTYTVHANDTVIWFDLVGYFNFSGVLDTAYHRRVVTIIELESNNNTLPAILPIYLTLE
jgi:hypothetical protein